MRNIFARKKVEPTAGLDYETDDLEVLRALGVPERLVSMVFDSSKSDESLAQDGIHRNWCTVERAKKLSGKKTPFWFVQHYYLDSNNTERLGDRVVYDLRGQLCFYLD